MAVYIPPLNRRTFLKTTSLAATGLMIGCTDSITGSYSDGNDVPVDPNYFALLADTHIDHPKTTAHGYLTAENLEMSVQRILNNPERLPAGVIINGDFGDSRATADQYGLAKWILKPLSEAGIPIYITIGNHDLRDQFFQVFEDYLDENGPVTNRHVGMIETPNVYMLLADTSEGMSTPGMFRDHQLQWINDFLHQKNDKPVLIFGHHPAQDVADFEAFYNMVKPHKHAKAFIAGHRHRMELNMRDDFHLLMQPPVRGTGQTTPIGFFHAQILSDRLDFVVDNIIRSSHWHGRRYSLAYR
jgi:3',5'-cyclic-AMP phosphodiesterase